VWQEQSIKNAILKKVSRLFYFVLFYFILFYFRFYLLFYFRFYFRFYFVLFCFVLFVLLSFWFFFFSFFEQKKQGMRPSFPTKEKNPNMTPEFENLIRSCWDHSPDRSPFSLILSHSLSVSFPLFTHSLSFFFTGDRRFIPYSSKSMHSSSKSQM
jgi:energy-coupling factor transporter transmembrane protein EcfT